MFKFKQEVKKLAKWEVVKDDLSQHYTSIHKLNQKNLMRSIRYISDLKLTHEKTIHFS